MEMRRTGASVVTMVLAWQRISNIYREYFGSFRRNSRHPSESWDLMR
jgi:hypothetical protein